MTIIKRRTIWSMMFFLLLAACYNEEAVSPPANASVSEFIGSKLATVQVATDYEVNFWEVSPGNVIVDVYRSIEAEMKAPAELKAIINGNKYVEMYKKLAGKSANLLSIEKLEEAELRSNDPSLKIADTNREALFLNTAADNSLTSEEARTAAPVVPPKCSPDQFNDNYGAQWFYDNYVIESSGMEAWHYMLSTAPQSSPISTDANVKYSIDVMNGQFTQAGRPNNVVSASVAGVFSGTINPRSIRTFKMGPNLSGFFRNSFTNGLKCPTTHAAFHLSNI